MNGVQRLWEVTYTFRGRVLAASTADALDAARADLGVPYQDDPQAPQQMVLVDVRARRMDPGEIPGRDGTP